MKLYCPKQFLLSFCIVAISTISARGTLMVTFNGTLDDGLNTPISVFFELNDVRPADGTYQSTTFSSINYALSRETTSQTRLYDDVGSSLFTGSVSVEDSASEPYSRFDVLSDSPTITRLALRLDSDLDGNGLFYLGSPIDGLDFDADIAVAPLSDYSDNTLRPSQILPLGTFNVTSSAFGRVRFTDSTPTRNITFSTVTVAVLSANPVQADRLIGADRNDGLLFELDPATGAVSNPVLLPYLYENPESGYYNGLTRHPGTGAYYVLVGASDTRPILATVDDSDGSFAAIAPVGVYETPGGSPSLTFGPAPDYTLYLITGGASYSTHPGGIYVIHPMTGEASDTGWITSGIGAHAIEYNPSDGFLYHFYNTDEAGSGTTGLEKINLSTGSAINIPLSGATYGKVNGLAYANGLFYVVDNSAKTLHSVSPAGVVTLIGSVADRLKNLASDGTSLFALARGVGAGMREIDPATGATLNNVLTGASPRYREMKGLARNPVNGKLYGLTYPDYPAGFDPTLLVEIDPLSGSITNPVTLSIANLDELAFDSSGTLYGLAANRDGTLPDELEGGTMATINIATGIVTAQAWATSKNRFLDQTFAFNPDDGLLYHVYSRPDENDFIDMESVNPVNGVVTPIGEILSGQTGRSASALTYDSTAGLFFLGVGRVFYTVTPTGAVTVINGGLEFPYDLAGLAIEPDLEVTSIALDGSGATIGFKSVENREYGLYGSTNLIDWAPVTGFENIPATAPENTETNVPLPSSTKGFYRVGTPTGN